MRIGDFGLEVLPTRGSVRELDTGHVLARPGEVYLLRLRNFGPLRCVTDVRIDGKPVTAGGLVLDAWSYVDLERPVDDAERGRFTVVAEGSEQVFGPDGGRDNPDLGLIEARFRRELPRQVPKAGPTRERPLPPTLPRPMAPPGWRPDWLTMPERPYDFQAIASRDIPAPPAEDAVFDFGTADGIEQAAGTGLTGYSSQEFETIHVGPLESEATVVRVRIVIGTEEAIESARPLPNGAAAPARPAARP